MIHVLILIFGAVIILCVGAVFGFIICSAFKRQSTYSGVMKIIKEEDRVLYSLELLDSPELLLLMDEILFKVETSDESSNRK